MKRMSSDATRTATRQAAFETWKIMALEDIDAFKSSMEPPSLPAYPASVRGFGKWVCGPLGCAPCIFWSCVARILCCCQPHGMYMNSDRCIINCYKVMDAKQQPLHARFSKGELHGIPVTVLRPIFEAFFSVMDHVAWPYHMMDWLEAQLKLFGYHVEAGMLVPSQAREVVNQLLNGDCPNLPIHVGERQIGIMKENRASLCEDVSYRI